MKKLIILVLFFVCINLTSAATLYGSIYTWDLEPISNVQVSIDSTPQQSMISTDGSYSFELNPGTYNLIAAYIVEGEIIANSEDEIIIEEDGSFRYDIILFPTIDYDENIGDIPIDDLDDSQSYTWIYYVLTLIVILVLIYFLRKKKKPKKTHSEHDEADEVLEIIKKQGGRTTQKEIRKAFPLSEAKISLIISELQHKNKIEKIKKGRGNIIILKK